MLKLGVGLMLTSFGTFWGAEGGGCLLARGDVALLGLLAFFTCASLVLVRLLGHRRTRLRPLGVET